MLDFLIIVVVLYLLWKIIKPRILRPSERHDLKSQEPPASLNIDKTQIEDAEFKEIDEPDQKNNH